MKTVIKTTYVIFSTLLILLGGCKKGADGAPGKDGKDGSVNVTSRTFSVSSWSSNSSRWYTQLSMPELTSANVNTAAVLVYIGTTSNNWIAIPSTVVLTTNYFWGFIYTLSIVEVRWDYNGVGIGSDPNTIYGATVQVKVVVIPPSLRKKDVDHTDYTAVANAYQLN